MDVWSDLGLLGSLERRTAINTAQAPASVWNDSTRIRAGVSDFDGSAFAAGAVQPISMKLETHEGRVPGPITADVIAATVAQLTAVDKAYIILDDDIDAETYVQAAGTLAEDFLVERRDGCAGEHYRGDRRVSANELVTMLVGCLHGATDWSHVISWHRVRVDFGAANANA